MKKKVLFLFSIILLFACESGVKIDPSPMSGTISQGDEKTAIVEKLAAAYRAGTFELAKEYFTTDGKHYFNNIEYTVNETIDGYNFHSVLYDNIEHVNPTVTTMYFNNGEIYTNQWSDWSGKSKITGDIMETTFHCWWQWEGDKIVSTKCYMDPKELMAEAGLYQENMASADSN